MQTKTKTTIVSMLTVLSLLFFSDVLAQENAAPEARVETEVVATVEIYNSQIVSQEKNDLKIAFDFYNKEKNQSDVRYAIDLVKKFDGGQELIDEYVFSEKLSLGEGEMIRKEVEYVAPAYLNGRYDLWLVAKNSAGLSLAMSSVGEVDLEGKNDFVEMVNSSCRLKKEGMTAGRKLERSIEVDEKEPLFVSCDVVNNFDFAVELVPNFSTYAGSSLGEAVGDGIGKKVILGAGEKKNVDFALPVKDVAGMYQVIVGLERDGIEVSNKGRFVYSVKGKLAAIQNVRVDKDYYAQGEKAKASLFWMRFFPSMDNGEEELEPEQIFKKMVEAGSVPQIDIFGEILITDSKGAECSDKVRNLLGKNNADIGVDIRSDCVDPNITATLVAADGSVLDSKKFQFESKGGIKEAKESQGPGSLVDTANNKNGKLSAPRNIFAAFFILIFCVTLAVAYFKKKRINHLSIYVGLVIGLGFVLIAGSQAKAVTFYVNGTYGSLLYTINLNKSFYNPGEQVNITSSVFNTDPPSGVKHAWVSANIIGPIDGTANTKWSPGPSYGYGVFVYGQQTVGFPTMSFVAPASDGNYNATARAYWDLYDYWGPALGTVSIPYTVGYASCALPWGGTIAHGAWVTAYSASSVVCGSTCASVSQTRTCNNGVLSGTYTNQNCSVAACPVYACTGEAPVNSSLCAGDDTGLTADAPRTVVDSCTAPTKCEYTCNAGYEQSGNLCMLTPPPTFCGNGIVEPGEQCDGGFDNGNCPSVCSNSCTTNSCSGMGAGDWREVAP